MVNNRIVSRFTGRLPASAADDRRIEGGPIYPVAEVLELLSQQAEQSLVLWTRKCKNDLQNYGLDLDDARDLLRSGVQRGRFLGAEWCVQAPNGPWAACDAYSVIRREWVDAAHKEMDFEYYIKFAIGKTGSLLLLVSCHPSQDRS